LFAALLGDGIWDALSWLGLGIAVLGLRIDATQLT
jgi:hypothetical protein